MIEGLKLSIPGSALKAKISKSINWYQAQIDRYTNKGGSLIVPVTAESSNNQVRQSLEAIARLKFISTYLIDTETYLLGWGDCQTLGMAAWFDEGITK